MIVFSGMSNVRGSSKARVLVICPHPPGVAPGQRLKYEQYFAYFEANGFEVVVSPFMTQRFWEIVYLKGRFPEKVFWTAVGYLRRLRDLLRIPFYDAIYVFLWVTPFGPALSERLVGLLNKSMVYDIDDMVFLGHSSQANRLIGRLKGNGKMPQLMKIAQHVIVCTPRLEEYAKQLNPRVTDISSTIDTDEYTPVVKHWASKKPIVIGWSGSHSTSKYLRLLEPVLEEMERRYGTQVLVIGDGNFRFDTLQAEAIPWRRATEVEDLSRIDIGVYPLPDEEWVLGKSGLKALQYMALGIPTVATAIGANFRVIQDGVSGFLVRTEDEWQNRLAELIESAELRTRMGAAARERVEKHYSVRANQDTYLEILSSVAGR